MSHRDRIIMLHHFFQNPHGRHVSHSNWSKGKSTCQPLIGRRKSKINSHVMFTDILIVIYLHHMFSFSISFFFILHRQVVLVLVIRIKLVISYQLLELNQLLVISQQLLVISYYQIRSRKKVYIYRKKKEKKNDVGKWEGSKPNSPRGGGYRGSLGAVLPNVTP